METALNKAQILAGKHLHQQDKLWTRTKMSSKCAGVWHLKPKSQYEDFKETRHEEQSFISQAGAVALMPVLGQSRTWEQLEEAEAHAFLSHSLQTAGRSSSKRNMPWGWTNFLWKHGGGAGQGDAAGLEAPSLEPCFGTELMASQHPEFMAGSFGKCSPSPWSVRLVGQTHPIEGYP